MGVDSECEEDKGITLGVGPGIGDVAPRQVGEWED